MGIGAPRPGRRPGPGAMSDRGPTPCARGRCLPLIQPFSLVPALLSRAFNAALGKRQTRKKHHGHLPSLSLSLSPYHSPISLSRSIYLRLLPNSRASRRADRRTSQGTRGGRSEPRANDPLYSRRPLALCSRCCSFRSSSRIYPRST